MLLPNKSPAAQSPAGPAPAAPRSLSIPSCPRPSSHSSSPFQSHCPVIFFRDNWSSQSLVRGFEVRGADLLPHTKPRNQFPSWQPPSNKNIFFLSLHIKAHKYLFGGESLWPLGLAAASWWVAKWTPQSSSLGGMKCLFKQVCLQHSLLPYFPFFSLCFCLSLLPSLLPRTFWNRGENSKSRNSSLPNTNVNYFPLVAVGSPHPDLHLPKSGNLINLSAHLQWDVQNFLLCIFKRKFNKNEQSLTFHLSVFKGI